MPEETGGPNSEQAIRMRTIRRMIEGDDDGAQVRFAQRLKINYRRWNNVERGKPVSIQLAEILVKAIPGLKLDWIYSGDTEVLNGTMLKRLEEAAERPNRSGA